MIPIALLLLVTVASVVTCHQIAKRRGADPVFWGVMAVLFGPLAIPFVFLSKRRQ